MYDKDLLFNYSIINRKEVLTKMAENKFKTWKTELKIFQKIQNKDGTKNSYEILMETQLSTS